MSVATSEVIKSHLLVFNDTFGREQLHQLVDSQRTASWHNNQQRVNDVAGVLFNWLHQQDVMGKTAGMTAEARMDYVCRFVLAFATPAPHDPPINQGDLNQKWQNSLAQFQYNQ